MTGGWLYYLHFPFLILLLCARACWWCVFWILAEIFRALYFVVGFAVYCLRQEIF
jgi:hypothetical protein